MKAIKTILLAGMALTMLFSCNLGGGPKDDREPKQTHVDTSKVMPDVVLENPAKDAEVFARKAKKKPAPPPPVDTTTHPPVITGGCILLDLDGYTVSGTLWNVNGVITCAGSGLSPVDQQLVLDSVRAHFAMFAITVTTSDSIFNSFPADKRMRVIATTSYEWFGNGAGGVSYINSFNWNTNEPCFVFTSLLEFNVKWISDACSHEPGHTLGLRHQSSWIQNADGSWTLINDYNWGDEWTAPIMGGSYRSGHPMWWIGRNSIGVEQNDTLIIKSKL